MSADVYLISDTHFGHANILTFEHADGTKMRKFDSIEQMDECIIDNWNSVVRPQDHVYHLGDVAMNKRHIPTIGRCNGKKRLVLGNHDYEDMRLYQPYFQKIFSTRLFDRYILSHVPIHPDSIGKSIANIHGHTHNRWSQGHLGPNYYNVSCEMIDFTPIHIEELKKRMG